MADVLNATAWQESDASNSSGTQPSFPENMPGKDLNNASRAMMGALKRFVNQICGTKTTAGTASAYTIAYTVAPEALYQGQRFTVIAHADCTAAPSLNVNSLGAKTISKISNGVVTDLAATEIKANAVLDLMYSASLNKFIWLNPPPPATSLTDATSAVKGIIELATRGEVQFAQAGDPWTRLAVTPDTIGAILYKGLDVAGATSISLGDGGFFTITGTGWSCTGIVFAVASSPGRSALIRFAATGTLVNGATLVLPTGGNISVEAGDTCEVILDTSAVYRVYNYLRASGAQLAAAGVGTAGRAVKNADTSRTNTTLADDPDLKFAGGAGERYSFEAYLSVNVLSTTPGFKVAMNTVSSVPVTKINYTARIVNSSAVTTTDVTATLDTTVQDTDATAATYSCKIWGVVEFAAAATLAVRWAQAVSGSTTIVEKNSWIKWDKLA